MTIGQDLGEPLERFIMDQVASGRYKDADDVIRATLQLLQVQEAENGGPSRISAARCRKDVDSGPGTPAEEVFDRLKTKYQRMARQDAE